MITKMKTSLVTVALLTIAPLAQAQTTEFAGAERMGYVGISAGYADPTAIDGRFGLGADAGLMFANGMIGSVFYRTSMKSESGRETRVDHYGLGADWSLARLISGPAGGFRAGVRAGASVLDKEKHNGDAGITDTEFAVGPSLGYDLIHLPYNFSIGGEANLMFTQGPAQFSTLYVLANLKYWF